MRNFITSYKWINLPVVLCSAAILSSAAFATPSTSQQYQDAQQTSRLSQQYVGGNTQIGAGITDQGNVDAQINHTFSSGQNHSTSGGLWADFELDGDDKGIQGRGVEVNHNWVSRGNNGQALRVNKAKLAYDQNAAGHDKVTVGYGQETDKVFWDARVSKGLSGIKDSRDTGNGTISDRAYEYGVGASIGKFLPDSNLRIRGGLDHEWSTQVGTGEDDARSTTLSAGAEKFFEGTGHSVSLDVSGSARSGGYEDGGSSDNDYSARIGYKYDFAGSSAFQNVNSSRRIRVEVPGNAIAPRYESRTEYKKVPTYKTVPVYANKAVKVPYKRMVKSTMALEGQTFFKLNSSKLIPSAQKRLTEVANQIKKTGYKGSIRITGNTCGLGNAHYDQILSEKRAKSVRNYLIKQGFNPDHLMARGLGKDHPKFKNIPGEGFKNRRVDIEYVTEKSTAQTAYRTEQKSVQTGTKQVASGFKNVAAGTKNVLIDNGQAGTPRVIWKTETVNNPPAWIQRGLHNNIKHDRSVNTFQTTEGFDKIGTIKANNDNVATACGIPVTINVLGNDDSSNGIFLDSFTQGANGVVTQGANGSLIYTPNKANCDVDDTFTYSVIDADGNVDSATVTVAVAADDNVVAENEAVTAQEGQAVTIDVLNNDDPDATINRILTNPANGTVEIVDGKIIYTPDAGFTGTDSFTYEVIDGNGNIDSAEVTIDVTSAENIAPAAQNDSDTTPQGEAVTLDVLDNDTTNSGSDELTISSVGNPSNGTAIIVNGEIVYTPDADHVGTDTFTYTIVDSNGQTAVATAIVTVVAADKPLAQNDSDTTPQGEAVTLDVLDNDTTNSGSDELTISSVGSPSNGTAVIVNGEILYTPDADHVGTDTFTYTITDSNGQTAVATATVTVTEAPNTKPEAVDDSVTTEESTAVTLNTVANDTDADGDDLTITNVSQPSNGTAVISNDGKRIIYTPDDGFTGIDVFDYTISDGNGGTAMATETVIVEALPNKSPTAVTDSMSTGCAIITIDALANDFDPENDNLTITSVTGASLGTATVVGNKIVFTPSNTCDKGSTGTDTLTYTISDGVNTSTGIINIDVEGEESDLNAENDSVTTEVNTPIDINVLANDTGIGLTITAVDTPVNGTVSYSGGIITYTPNSGYIGQDDFYYDIVDQNGEEWSAMVIVEVTEAGVKTN